MRNPFNYRENVARQRAKEEAKHPERYSDGARLSMVGQAVASCIEGHTAAAAEAAARGDTSYTAVIGPAQAGAAGAIIERLTGSGWTLTTTIGGTFRSSIVFSR